VPHDEGGGHDVTSCKGKNYKNKDRFIKRKRYELKKEQGKEVN
jgi:hypothetical protein